MSHPSPVSPDDRSAALQRLAGDPLAPSKPAWNGFAIASLPLGFIAPFCGAGTFSVVFGIIALVQIKRTRERGKGLAIGGLVATGAWLAAIAVALIVAAGR